MSLKRRAQKLYFCCYKTVVKTRETDLALILATPMNSKKVLSHYLKI